MQRRNPVDALVVALAMATMDRAARVCRVFLLAFLRRHQPRSHCRLYDWELCDMSVSDDARLQ
jgi:hypothetical protein